MRFDIFYLACTRNEQYIPIIFRLWPTLRMDTASSTKTLLSTCKPARCHNPAYNNLNTQDCAERRSVVVKVLCCKTEDREFESR
jgi:hypothetical protein